MKQFIVDRHTTPETPAMREVPTMKVPVYATDADAEADLSNLAEGQIIATLDTGDEFAQPVDAVESGNLHAVTSNAVAESIKPVFIQGGTNAGGNFIDSNGNSISVSDYSTAQYISIQNASGYILTPYKSINETPSQAKWALWDPSTNNWVINKTGLFAIFRK